MGGGRDGFDRRDRDPVLAVLAKPHLGIARHLPVQRAERLGHLCTKSADKRSGILAAAELAVIVGAACFEIAWQIVVRIAVAVRAHHPDLLAAQTLAYRGQYAHPIFQPVDPRTPAAVLFHHTTHPSGGAAP